MPIWSEILAELHGTAQPNGVPDCDAVRLYSHTAWVPSDALSGLVRGNGSVVAVDLRSVTVPVPGIGRSGRAGRSK